MVEPQPMSWRTTNSCMGTPTRLAICFNRKDDTAVVA